ncbi:hypothetical protein pb186bvf_007947 [Paramecium bursaria]
MKQHIYNNSGKKSIECNQKFLGKIMSQDNNLRLMYPNSVYLKISQQGFFNKFMINKYMDSISVLCYSIQFFS